MKKISADTTIVIIGIDCAVEAKNVGIAKGKIIAGRLHIGEVATERSWV